jgi:glycosyltransferase involved in cell wall biosynthesis
VISILILTLNEETNIGQCLDCLTWSDDVVVFDSFSSDRTVDIARERGARWFERKFDGRAPPELGHGAHRLQAPLGLLPRRRRAHDRGTARRDLQAIAAQ